VGKGGISARHPWRRSPSRHHPKVRRLGGASEEKDGRDLAGCGTERFDGNQEAKKGICSVLPVNQCDLIHGIMGGSMGMPSETNCCPLTIP
jgi:hypothetical protein